MFLVYDLIFLVLSIIYLPVYLFKRKFHGGFFARLGILPQDFKLNRPIWIHAVSVGEVMAVRRLMEELRINYPNKNLVISTVTFTGNKIAKSISSLKDFVTYLPLDFSFIVKKVIDRINPSLFIIAETELWPNLISHLNKRNIPIILVNGRISDRSFKKYLAIKFLLKPILNKVNLFCVQASRDAERFAALGVSRNNIHITGNMKFDTAKTIDFKKDDTDYRMKLGLKSEDKLFVVGSSHPGEEEIILEVYKDLLPEFLDLRLLIAPRHLERASAIADLIRKFDFEPIRISLLSPRAQEPKSPRAIFILDTIGQLVSFYATADIVFVGGSLVKKGGHNILEPASFGKPVLFGPYMFNFSDIAELFLKNQAAISVHNSGELKEKIKWLLSNPKQISAISEHAKTVILENQGATRRSLNLIKDLYAKLSL